MSVKFAFDNPLLRTWLLLHQTSNLVVKAEDAVFAKDQLTSQQHAVLLAMKYIEGPVTPSVIAHWLDRNTNTITTLVDRIEKQGLVKRVRDLRDRRSVRLEMTAKGKEAIDRATVTGWQLVEDILGGLSEDDLRTLINLLEIVRGRAFDYLNPGKALEEVKPKDEAGNMARFLARRALRNTLDQGAQIQSSQAKT